MSTALPLITAPTNPHYASVGGAPAVQRLVDAFYAAMDSRADARAIRAMHPADLSATKAVLADYLTEWLGGPKLYSAARGAPRLGRVHAPYAIDAAARSAWLACMGDALDTLDLDTHLRATLATAFAKVAHHLERPASVQPHHRSLA